jgi:hypothetical protein
LVHTGARNNHCWLTQEVLRHDSGFYWGVNS